MEKGKTKYEYFEDWAQAFDTCRERGKPINVSVFEPSPCRQIVNAKIFPSGRVEELK